MNVGARVVWDSRGKHTDERSNDQEGVVGTVKNELINSTGKAVTVQWDSGFCRDHQACNLRVLDSAPAGVCHPEVRCCTCQTFPLPGTRWHCLDCDNNYNLCTLCYNGDRHEKHHTFERIERPGQNRFVVGKRADAVKVQSRGIFPGAKVMRGPDWKYKNQDGGKGKEGVVKRIVKWKETFRGGVLVSWDETGEGKYRLSYEGKVDVRCIALANGGWYYKEHLPDFGRKMIQESSYKEEKSTSGGISHEIGVLPPVGEPKVISDTTETLNFPEDILTKEGSGKLKGGRVPLHKAAIQGQLKLAEAILSSGEAVDIRDQFQLSPLHLACWYGEEAMVKLLLAHGADVNAVDRFQKTPLQKSQKRGHEAIQRILEENGGKQTFNPVSLTSFCKEAVKRIERTKGFNLLQAASFSGNYAMVSKCLMALDDWKKELQFESTLNNATTLPGMTAYEIASSNSSSEHKKIVNYFKEREEVFDSLSDLHKCVKQQDVEAAVELVLEETCLVDTLANGNRTPLLWASAFGNSEVIKALLDLGANVNVIRSDNYLTPLSLAAACNNYMAVKLLVENVADTDYVANCKRPALHEAVREGNFEVVRLLLQFDCPLNSKDEDGFPALHLSLTSDKGHFTELLLEKGGDPNICMQPSLGDRVFVVRGKDKGRPAWHYVLVDKSKLAIFRKRSSGGSLDVADFGAVLKSGWGQDPPDELKEEVSKQFGAQSNETASKTPLHLASERNLARSIELLLNHNADLNAQDADGYTPLHVAVCHGNLEAVEELVKHRPDHCVRTKDNFIATQLAKLNEEEEILNHLELLVKSD